MCLVVCGIRAFPEARPPGPPQPDGEAASDAVDSGGAAAFELELTDGAPQECDAACLIVQHVLT